MLRIKILGYWDKNVVTPSEVSSENYYNGPLFLQKANMHNIGLAHRLIKSTSARLIVRQWT